MRPASRAARAQARHRDRHENQHTHDRHEYEPTRTCSRLRYEVWAPGCFGSVPRADDGARTRDLRLGKPTLYQLSYVREACIVAVFRRLAPRLRATHMPQTTHRTKASLNANAVTRLELGNEIGDRLHAVAANLRLSVERDTRGASVLVCGAGAPWFYEGRRGLYANRLETLAKRARAK
jgi:hypothetical protein